MDVDDEVPEIVDRFALTERCLQEGICPNGCGPLLSKSDKERVCPRCGARHFNATPDRQPHATE